MQRTKYHPWIIAAALAVPVAAYAQSIEWINPAGGNWNDTGNWDGGEIPDIASESASINADGTYTVNANQGVNLSDVTLGTTSTAGKQTVNLNTFSGFNFANMTIGPNGVFQRHQNGNLGGTGTLTIQNGGLFSQSGTDKGVGGHHIVVEAGGQFHIASGAALSPDGNTHLTINGTLSGEGRINGDQNGHVYSGSGTIELAGGIDLAGRGSVWSGLTVNSDITARGAFLIPNGQSITLNGTFTNTNGTRGFGPQNNGETATVTGAGDINITTSTADLRLGGANGNNNGGGTINFTGTGALNLAAHGETGYISITSSTMNIQRDTTISGSDGGYVRIGGDNNAVNVRGTGNTLTINAGGILLIDSAFHEARSFNVYDGAELLLNGGSILGKTGDGGPIVNIGQSTAGTLALAAGTHSVLGASTTGNGSAPQVQLHANATVSAGAGASLTLAGAQVQIDITNPGQWGWDTAGAILIADNATRFEALSDDLGDATLPGDTGFSLKTLGFTDSGEDPVFTLFDNTNNDGLGSGDVALYVETLDLSGLNAGRTLTLAGFDGAERVYYLNLVNPNNVTLGANYVQIVPEPAALGLLGLAGLLSLRRRR